MTDSKDNPDERETLFETFDKKLEECEQKFSDIEKDLEEFRKEKNTEQEETEE